MLTKQYFDKIIFFQNEDLTEEEIEELEEFENGEGFYYNQWDNDNDEEFEEEIEDELRRLQLEEELWSEDEEMEELINDSLEGKIHKL